MTKNTYILCPGQGAQHVGMGRDYFDAHPKARELYEAANGVLGRDLASVCFDGPEEVLGQTDVAQPAIYVTSLASHAAAREAGLLPDPAACGFAGLSLGEYTALHLAGVFTFEEGLKLVAARGRFMQEAATAVPSGMVSIIGADEAEVSRLCEESAKGEVLVPANYNAPGQIVASGAIDACGRLAEAAAAGGFRAVPLDVAGAFHSPLMQPAADRMAAELEKVHFVAPVHPVWANVTAAPHGDPASIKKLLVEQIVKPVRWEQTMTKLMADADAAFIELAPGRVLTGLAKKLDRRRPIENLSAAPAKRES